MTLKTVLNKVIVEPVEAETVTKGGIIVPDTAQEKPQKGTVIATGKGKADEPMEVKAGDTVLEKHVRSILCWMKAVMMTLKKG